MGDTKREATSSEVVDLRQETRDLKEVVAELTLENRGLKKAWAALYWSTEFIWLLRAAKRLHSHVL
jgi:hypothetical protein